MAQRDTASNSYLVVFGNQDSRRLPGIDNRMLLQDRSKPLAVNLSGDRSYAIVFDELDRLTVAMRQANVRPGKVLVITDTNVAGHYRGRLDSLLKSDGWDPLILTLPAGEMTKSPKHLHAIYNAALAWKIDRQTPILAFGGGVVGDLAGYAAATLLRGLPFVQVPTSLIAQVDSAIGGKTGINHEEGKNLIGAFHQPKLVFVDPKLLYTLTRREWHSGLAEVVKHALIRDEAFFAWIESSINHVVARHPDVVPDLVYRAASIKAGVVSRDEKEHGERMILNFGHTVGHAVEKALGYGVFTHGEAIILGMRAAILISRRFNRGLEQSRVESVLGQIPLPKIPPTLSLPEVREAMNTDKKRDRSSLRFVLLKRVGAAYVINDVGEADIDAALAHALGRPF